MAAVEAGTPTDSPTRFEKKTFGVLLAIAGFFLVTLSASVVRGMRRRRPAHPVDPVAPEPEVVLDRSY